MITKAEIINFRGINALTIEGFSRLNIFVGRNGVGKTSIMEAIAIGATGGRPQFFDYLARVRGLPGFSEENPIGLEVYFGRAEAPLKITLCDENRCFITDAERSNIADSRNSTTTTKQATADDKSMEILPTFLPLPSLVFSEVSNLYKFSYSHPGSNGPTTHTRNLHLRPGGHEVHPDDSCTICPKGFYLKGGMANLAGANQLVDKLVRAGKREELVTMMRDVVPGVQDITPSAQSGAPLVKTGDAVVPAQVMGGGFVWLLTVYSQILLGNGTSSVAVIDEIETGLHHLSMPAMWENLNTLLRQMPQLQIFCSTHSEELLEKTLDVFREPQNRDLLGIFRVMKEPGCSLEVRKADYDTLETIHELGEGRTHVTG